jgi:hypothetical protein
MECVGKKVRIVSETTPREGQCLYSLTWKLKKMSIKNSNCVSAWTCLLCVGRVSVFSKYCHVKTLYRTGEETILAGRAEQFNLFCMDMKCVIWRENNSYKMSEPEKNTWTNMYKKSMANHRFLFVAYGGYYIMSVQRDRLQVIRTSRITKKMYWVMGGVNINETWFVQIIILY